MQPLGIVLASLGLWVIYCGVHGVNPITTGQAVIKDPAHARQLIADADAAAKDKYATLISAATVATSTVTGGGNSGSNPFAAFKVTSSWADHLARGSAGGWDFAMPVGTPIPSPGAGIVTNIPNNGTGGNTVRVKMANGYTEEFMHLSKFLKNTGDKVSIGSILGLSGGAKGAPGAGSSTGPHLHWDMISPTGQRVDPLQWNGGTGPTDNGSYQPKTPQPAPSGGAVTPGARTPQSYGGTSLPGQWGAKTK